MQDWILKDFFEGRQLPTVIPVLASASSYNGASFDVNIDGPTAGANNVCMLAAFGNGGTVPVDCVPVTGTQARPWKGLPGNQKGFGVAVEGMNIKFVLKKECFFLPHFSSHSFF